MWEWAQVSPTHWLSQEDLRQGYWEGYVLLFLLACHFYKVYFIFFPGEVMQVSPASFLFEINHIYEAYIIYFHQEVIFTASTSFVFEINRVYEVYTISFRDKSYFQRLRHLFSK